MECEKFLGHLEIKIITMNKKIILEIEKKLLTMLFSSEATHGLRRAIRGFLKELNIFKAHSNAVNKKIKTNKKCLVQIGGGRHYLQNFLNIDIISPADIIWDVRESIPLKSNSIKFLFSEHFLEHIDYPISANKFLKECYRVLDKNGQIVMGVPDSRLAIKSYYCNDKKNINNFIRRWYNKRDCIKYINTPIDFLNYHFRDEDNHEKYNPHLWAYDYEKLYLMLKNVGFSNIKKWKFDKNIANSKREWGSIYIMARK